MTRKAQTSFAARLFRIVLLVSAGEVVRFKTWCARAMTRSEARRTSHEVSDSVEARYRGLLCE